MTLGSVVIPAQDEASVIGRTLDGIAEAARDGRLDVVVVANGCTDDTAARARAVEGVRVVELSVGSKVQALRAGDRATNSWPRLYLDADIEIPGDSVLAVLEVLRAGRVPAARPAFRYEADRASWPVRRYYRARSRMPSLHNALWGAGVYGLSREGRSRFSEFPAVIGDDLFVDRLFAADEKMIVDCAPVRVHVPQRTRVLLRVLGRVYAGQGELGTQDTRDRTVAELRGVARENLDGAVCAAVYAAIVVLARLRLQWAGRAGWARDSTSR